MRLCIAERLTESQTTAAFLTTFNEIDLSSPMEAVQGRRTETARGQAWLQGAFSHACTQTLKEIPAANASIEISVPFNLLDPREDLCGLI
jgi:2-oxoglutarate dehydrogenase E2 component (dihydrolipoamide succinyltransferase)